MKTSITKLATIIILGAAMAAPTAAAVSRANVQQSVDSAVGAGNSVFASVNEGVVTLTGNFEGAYDKASAINAAEAVDGVNRVIDLTSVSR